MFPKYCLTFCSFVLLAAVASSSQQVQSHEDKVKNVQNTELSKDSVEARNPALAIAVRILQQAFRWAAKHCLRQAANNCRQHWKNPKALVNCARGFLRANKGRCVVG
ncbi:hypothetical protein TSAR_006103 [Trichomalopsis sarcophagae]|uniref:Secreted protein n=1 Tax=Trichomalopsis sarcophagae TaxID=543379 RepID=A0A232EYQ0_9HYME|nr:hypothetical protein TSAR_006103 [Trichomalopsis sarcophagae]